MRGKRVFPCGRGCGCAREGEEGADRPGGAGDSPAEGPMRRMSRFAEKMEKIPEQSVLEL